MHEDEIRHYLAWLLWNVSSPWCNRRVALMQYLGIEPPRAYWYLKVLDKNQPLTNKFKKTIRRQLPDILAGKVIPEPSVKRVPASEVKFLYPNPPARLSYPVWVEPQRPAHGFAFLRARG